MTDNNDHQPPQPFQPPERGAAHYKNLRREVTAQRLGAIIADITTPTPTGGDGALPPAAVSEVTAKPQTPRRRLFDFHLNADLEEGETMDEPQLLINFAFKPIVPGLKLRPEESQLLLSYIGELLQAVEEEEQVIEGEKTSENMEAAQCP